MPRKQTLEDLQILARSRGGECVSDTYSGANVHHRWQCHAGHLWNARPGQVKVGTWCPFCAGRGRYTAEFVQEAASARGGRLVTDKSKFHVEDEATFECAQGHQWSAQVGRVANGKSWCRTCGYDQVSKKLSGSLDELHNLARHRGGQCLSTEYPRRGQKARWKCVNGHEWDAQVAAVKHGGTWCPSCMHPLISESFCRALIEAQLGKAFPKARPAWLKPENGRRLELDGYCRELALAFEYQGQHHYNAYSYTGGADTLARRQSIDALKRHLCELHGVRLVEIPYTMSQHEIVDFLTKTFTEWGFGAMLRTDVDLSRLAYYPSSRLDEMKAVAQGFGGTCLADRYVSVREPVRWRCGRGHEWLSAFHEVKNKGHWCLECSGSRKLTLDEIQAVAASRGGRCLSTEYISGDSHVEWECSAGHQWSATPNMVRNAKSWCPHCAGTARLSLNDAIDYARSRGGECLSTSYVNGRTKMRWRCSKGHVWEAAYGSMRNGNQWCRQCSGKAPFTLAQMHAMAAERGGECLSTSYINLTTPLEWRCGHGHTFRATPNAVRYGKNWCAACRKTK